jgi:isopenicillin-N epimerase
MLREFPLDPSITYLNHGTVGVAPIRSLLAQQNIRDEIERQPARFQLRELTAVRVGGERTEPPRMRQAARLVAEFVAARGEDVVFVDNATTGANAVLRSFPLQPGDELLVTSYGYGGVTNAARYVARERGAELRTVQMPFPEVTPEAVVAVIAAAIGPRTRLAVVDHISSDHALVLPIRDIAARCRERSVALLVDGAHAPAAIALDIPSIGADWYVANLHKWAFVPRSSGILWAAPERQQRLHPAVISWGLDQGFTTEFDLPGTRDPSAHLAAPAALALWREFGGEEVRRWNHELVWRAAHHLAALWGVRFATPESMIGCMATLALPAELGSSEADAARLRDALLFEDRIEVGVKAAGGRLWVRIAAQIYNEMADYERLGDTITRRAGVTASGRSAAPG